MSGLQYISFNMHLHSYDVLIMWVIITQSCERAWRSVDSYPISSWKFSGFFIKVVTPTNINHFQLQNTPTIITVTTPLEIICQLEKKKKSYCLEEILFNSHFTAIIIGFDDYYYCCCCCWGCCWEDAWSAGMDRMISESPGSVTLRTDTRKNFPHAVPSSMLLPL